MDSLENLKIKKPGYYHKVQREDILYIRKDYRKVIVELEDSAVALYCDKNFISNVNFRNFFKVHTGLVVNLDNIIKMSNGYIYFQGGKALKIGVSNFRKLLKEV